MKAWQAARRFWKVNYFTTQKVAQVEISDKQFSVFYHALNFFLPCKNLFFSMAGLYFWMGYPITLILTQIFENNAENYQKISGLYLCIA